MLVCRLGTADNEARGQDPELVQHAHGEGHQALVEDVGRGGEDGGDPWLVYGFLSVLSGRPLRTLRLKGLAACPHLPPPC
jgi:hypothetical protein